MTTRDAAHAAHTTQGEGVTVAGRKTKASPTWRAASSNITPAKQPATVNGGAATNMTRVGSAGGGRARATSTSARLAVTRRTTTTTVDAVTAGTSTSAAAEGATATTSTTGAATVAAPVAAAVMVIVVLFLLVLALLAGGAVDEDQRAGAHRLAQTATDEYLEGEERGDQNHKRLKYSAYVLGSYGGKDDWDICFVTWCMGQAGFVDGELVARYSNVTSYIAHFRHQPELGEVHEWYGEPYAPVEGDLFIAPPRTGSNTSASSPLATASSSRPWRTTSQVGRTASTTATTRTGTAATSPTTPGEPTSTTTRSSTPTTRRRPSPTRDGHHGPKEHSRPREQERTMVILKDEFGDVIAWCVVVASVIAVAAAIGVAFALFGPKGTEGSKKEGNQVEVIVPPATGAGSESELRAWLEDIKGSELLEGLDETDLTGLRIAIESWRKSALGGAEASIAVVEEPTVADGLQTARSPHGGGPSGCSSLWESRRLPSPP